MLNAPGLVLPDAREALAVALDVGVKATVLLVIALAAHAAVGRRRALVRSALWNACLVGLLVLPVASLAFPRLRLVVLPTQEVAASAAPSSPSRNRPATPAGFARRSVRGRASVFHLLPSRAQWRLSGRSSASFSAASAAAC